MARKLSVAQILRDLRAKWTPKQVQERTAIPVKTQSEILGGRTSGATYEASLRESRRRGDQKRETGEGLQRLPQADDIADLKRLKQNPARWATNPRQFAATLNYRRDLQKAREAAKRRGEKFSVSDFDQAVMDLNRERRKLEKQAGTARRQGRYFAGERDRSAGGPMSRYQYLIGQTDRVMAVESL